MVYIAHYIELNLQIGDYAQKRRICRKYSKYAFDEIFKAIFAFDERLPTSATLLQAFIDNKLEERGIWYLDFGILPLH